MAGLKLNKRLERIIGQIKFVPKLASWQNTIAAAQNLEEKYDEWRMNKQGDVLLISPSERKVLRASYNSIIYSNEGDCDTTELTKHIETLYRKSIKDSGVTDVKHVGIRTIQIIETSFKFKELSDLIYNKFYKKDFLGEISAEKVNDTIFVLDGEKNGISNHVKIGPMAKKEALQHFSSTFEVDDSKLLGDSYLFVDVDTYVSDFSMNSHKLDEMLPRLLVENKRISDGYLGYIEKIE
jgi:hypothetical protein